MSMIALSQRLRPGSRGLGRTLLLLLGVTAAIIIGLLAMHSLNGHVETTAPAAAAMVMHEAGAADDGAAQPATYDDCADCGGHSSMLTMTCVLVLFAVSLLLLIPRMGAASGAPLRPRPAVRVVRSADLARPPSLDVLCISRT